MCGIAGFHVKNPKAKRTEEAVNVFVDKLLLGVEERGRQATGFVAVTDDKRVILDKAPVTAAEFIKDREKIPGNVRTVLLHTRYSTKGEVENTGNNHPVVYKSCFTTHNGSIYNDDDLFREHGLKRNYEVDTEIIPALLDKNGLGDMEHIKESLTKFRGPLAIATIDPVNHPHKLLLAKGEHSPLVILENENLIVWASLQSALREAWGSVFGTPPRADKYNYLREGDIIVVDGETVTKDRYTVALPFTQYARGGQTGPAWKRNQERARAHQHNIRNRTGTNSGTSGVGSLWGLPTAPFQNESEFIKAVAWYREQGNGNARIWKNRDKLDDKIDFDDVKPGEPISWVPCKCGEAVLAQDMRRHIKYGHICIDCYVVIRNKYDEKIKAGDSNVVSIETARERQTLALGRGTEDEPKYRAVPEKDRVNMESWAAVEAEAHNLILKAVAADSGYSESLVDFLVFRTGAMASDFGVAMSDLKTQLHRAYEELTPIVWEEHGEALLNGSGGPEQWDSSYDYAADNSAYYSYTVKKPGGVSEVWFLCAEHGENFRQGDDCPTCNRVDNAVDEIMQEAAKDEGLCDECGLSFPKYQLVGFESFVLCKECRSYFIDPCSVQDKDEKAAEVKAKLDGLQRCPECKTFISNKYPCKVCEVRAAKEPDPVPIERLVNIKPEHVKSCKGNGDGKQCRRKVKFHVGNIGGYCKRHFESCSETRCVKDANTVLPDGRRVCHGHARGKQGAFADKALQKSGVVYQEVK